MPKISGGDIAHIAVSALPPTVILAAVLVARSFSGQRNPPEVLFNVAAVGAALWLVASLAWSATRPLRGERAAQRLDELRAESRLQDRALVLLQTSVWVASAGQHAVVVHVQTGDRYPLWLPECDAPIGSFVLVERQDGQAVVVRWLGPRTVNAAHRVERRLVASRSVDRQPESSARPPRMDESAKTLVREIEDYLNHRE